MRLETISLWILACMFSISASAGTTIRERTCGMSGSGVSSSGEKILYSILGSGTNQHTQHLLRQAASGAISGKLNFALAPVSATERRLLDGLEPNYPNPFNPATSITYCVEDRSPVRIGIYDIHGKLVRTLLNGISGPGLATIPWDGKDANGSAVSSGIYFIRLETMRRTFSKKLVLLK